ncbi:MAG: NIL domain-containing protein [Microcystaceae cyanobacterium]
MKYYRRIEPESTKSRIYLLIPHTYQNTPILYQLIQQYRLKVNILGANLIENDHQFGHLDIEVFGYPHQIQQALDYLISLNLTVISKPNTDGDSWYY